MCVFHERCKTPPRPPSLSLSLAQVQGDHSCKIEALLLKFGCIKGVSHHNIAAAIPPPKVQKPGKSISRLDIKASQPSRR